MLFVLCMLFFFFNLNRLSYVDVNNFELESILRSDFKIID